MSTELARQRGEIAPLPEKPAHLVQSTGVGLEGLARVVRPSFVKIVQKNSADELVDTFGQGSIILTPDNILLCGPGEDQFCRFVPLMFYTEYCKWAPMALKGIEPMIVERSFDPGSNVGIKSGSPATWSEPHPRYADNPKYNYRYCEHLNYIIKLVDDDLMKTEPCLISFAKTNYTVGSRLAKLALAREANIFDCVYQLGTRTKEGQENSWKIYTVENACDRPWVTSPELSAAFQRLHENYFNLVKQQMLRAEYDIDAIIGSDEANTVAAGQTGGF